MNPSEPALLHRWTSLKVKTFPHQGFVRENGCIFLEAIIFILLSVLESNPQKLPVSGLTGLSAAAEQGRGWEQHCEWAPSCCCPAAPGMQGRRKHWRSKDRMKAKGREHARPQWLSVEGQRRVPSLPCQHKHACRGCFSLYKEALIQWWSVATCTTISHNSD